MILKYLKLVNYGGIYNGMGLYEIAIDFSKCQHRIVLIKGDNGSGKSTIESALKPIPDDNTSFIAGMDAMKEIEYYDELTGIIYSIKFTHECKSSSRLTRGYFWKTMPDGNKIDMNPSGNISSCKEVINEELELDPNFLTLIQLSSTKRGIADLKPADRKRFVNNIISSTEVYNNMYKNLSKKSSHYKALMNSISSKIDTIGNITQLEEELKNVEAQIKKAEDMIEQHTEVINKEKGMLISIDPNNELGKRIETFKENKVKFQSTIDDCNKKLNKIYAEYPKFTTVMVTQEFLDKLNSDISNLSYSIKLAQDKIADVLNSRQLEAKRLEDETAKLQSINGGNNFIEVSRIRDKLIYDKNAIVKRWGEIVNLDNITQDEFTLAYNIIKQISEDIITEFTLIPESMIEQDYSSILEAIDMNDSMTTEIDELDNIIEVNEYKVDALKSKPDNCTNNACPFISSALEAKKVIDKCIEKRKTIKSIKCLREERRDLDIRMDNNLKNKRLIRTYNMNKNILMKLNLGLDSYDNCITNIQSNLTGIMSVLNGLIEYSNDLKEYKSIDSDLKEVDMKYNSLNSQKDLIDMITNSIIEINKKLSEDSDMIDKYNLEIEENTKKYNGTCTLLEKLTEIYNLNIDLNTAMESLSIINDELDKDRSNVEKIEQMNSDIEKLNVNISELKSKLDPLRKSAESIRYKITVSTEYTKEYSEYNSMYSKIETLKYYCSPTTGIQLLFVNMYLNKILENANNILSKLFNGIFALLPLIVTENEFRIPVAVNGGLNHDDITSMSSAQVALISMIISISLLSQTSTKLNIIVGDEIDAPFDAENRREFIGILTRLMSLVQSSQCILISHNSEIPMSDCDVILLKNENDVITEGNIIWSYR